MTKLLLLLIPFASFGQYTVERIAYDPGGTNDTLWTRDGSNKDTLFRRVAGNYVFGNKPFFRKLWTSVDVMDWESIVGGKQNVLVSGTNIKTVNGNNLLGTGDVSISAAWGSVSGTLSNQTDLNNALNLKANQATPLFTNALGYTTGAGGTVTQATNKSTGVTLNKVSGRITMSNAALAAGAEVAFTLTNSFIAATDVVIVNMQSVGTANAYLISVGAVSAGSCSITVSNASAGSLSQAVVLNFIVVKSSIN